MFRLLSTKRRVHLSAITRLSAPRERLALLRFLAARSSASAANGLANLRPLLERIQTDEGVPDLARELFGAQAEEYAQLEEQIAGISAKLMAWHKADECSRRVAKIPGIGPIGAALLMMKTPAPELFRSGRQFAALDRIDAEGPFYGR